MLDLELDSRASEQRLSRLLAALHDMRPLMTRIAQELLAQTERNVTLEGRPQWPVLALSTQKARARKGHGAAHPILRGRSPNLARNFSTAFSEQHAAIKNPTPYAAIHQFGGMAGRGHKTRIPARPFLPILNGQKQLTVPMQRAVNALIKAYLSKAARA